MAKINFNIIQTDKDYQIIEILTLGNSPISPEDLKGLQLPEGIDFSKGSIISGNSPVWLFTYLNHKLHIGKWAAVYDPKVGAVVVHSHGVASPLAGDVISNDELLKYFQKSET